MKRLIFFVFAFFFLLLPHYVFADEGWVIDNFNSNIEIQKTGIVKVDETIDVDFGTLSKHGIYRDIPYVYEQDGKKTYTEINVEGVMQNENKAKYSVTLTDGYVRIKIGDKNRTISGKNTYKITYLAKGVLRGFSDHDELYWNVTGNNWPVGINNAKATITLPTDGITKVACFQGYAGSQGECHSAIQSPQVAKFEATEQLMEAKGLTAVVGYKKGLVPLLTVVNPKTFWEKFIDTPSLIMLGIILAFGMGGIIYLWIKNGRDYWFGDSAFGKVSDPGSVKPIGTHETSVIEFTPPEELRPAEIGVLMDEKADTLDVVATIIDLASRGFLTITEVDKKWVFGKTDYTLTKKQNNTDGLMNYEKMLLNGLFSSGEEINVSTLKTTFYDDLKKIKDELYREVVEKKLFAEDPEKVRSKYFAAGFILAFIGAFLIGYMISFSNVFLTDLCVGAIISGLLFILFAKFMPRRTAYGRDLYRRIKGYRMFIDKSETYRQKFFEKKNLFNEVLPYAIVFGLTGKFAQAMDSIGVKSTAVGWYSGTHPFNMVYFGSNMNDFSSSMSSAIASTPSSSGGFSGGGSSGGGFGGGGGGSW